MRMKRACAGLRSMLVSGVGCSTLTLGSHQLRHDYFEIYSKKSNEKGYKAFVTQVSRTRQTGEGRGGVNLEEEGADGDNTGSLAERQPREDQYNAKVTPLNKLSWLTANSSISTRRLGISRLMAPSSSAMSSIRSRPRTDRSPDLRRLAVCNPSRRRKEASDTPKRSSEAEGSPF